MELSHSQTTAQKNQTSHFWVTYILPLIGLCALIVFLRVPTIHDSLGRDAGIYAYIGEHISQGDVLYRDLWDHKPPGIHYLLAVLFRIFPAQIETVAIFEIIWLCGLIIFFYLVAQRIFGRYAAFLAALMAAIYFASFQVIEYAGMTETYAVFFGLLAVWLTYQALERAKGWWWVLVGAALGAALLMRQTAVVVIVPLGVYASVLFYRRQNLFSHVVGMWGKVLAGMIGIIALPAIFFAIEGAWSQMMRAVFGFNQAYASSLSLVDSWQMLPEAFLHSPLERWPALSVIGIGGLLVGVLMKKYRAEWLFLTGWLLIEILGLSLGGRFYAHYFLHFVIPLALLSGFLFSAVPRLMVCQVIGVVGVVAFLFSHSPLLVDGPRFTSWVSGVVSEESVTSDETFGEQKNLALAWLQTHTMPGEPVYFWGAEAELNFISKRPSVGVFPFVYPLLVRSYTTQEDLDRFIADFERVQPQYVIDTSGTNTATPNLDADTGELGDRLFSRQAALPVMTYITSHYVKEESVGDWVVWRRR